MGNKKKTPAKILDSVCNDQYIMLLEKGFLRLGTPPAFLLY